MEMCLKRRKEDVTISTLYGFFFYSSLFSTENLYSKCNEWYRTRRLPSSDVLRILKSCREWNSWVERHLFTKRWTLLFIYSSYVNLEKQTISTKYSCFRITNLLLF